MDIITLGIGPGSDIPHLVLTGLGLGTPVPPVPGDPETSIVADGYPFVLSEGIAYALPPNVVLITCLTTTGTLAISLDAITWEDVILDSNKNFITSAVFISSLGGDSTIIAKKAF